MEPLLPNDPKRLGGWTLTGRLGEGGGAGEERIWLTKSLKNEKSTYLPTEAWPPQDGKFPTVLQF